MIRKAVIAIDSFKGSVSSSMAGMGASNAVRQIAPDCDLIVLEIADGGEGTVSAMTAATGATISKFDITGPLGQPVQAAVGFSADKSTAFIETASAAGLTLVSEGQLNPMLTTTFGLGTLIKKAVAKGCKRIIVGAGGSATVDGGTGMLQALGFRFLDRDNKPLEGNGGNLSLIRSIDSSEALDLSGVEIIVASDVDNPLCGPSGAASVFGPQKGATPRMVNDLEAGLLNLDRVATTAGYPGMTSVKGGGAAGGLSAALAIFCGAKIQSGIDTLLDIIDFDNKVTDADIVITGEGKIDNQTLGGKAPYGIAKRSFQNGARRVVAICGTVSPDFDYNKSPFTAVFPIVQGPCSLHDAMEEETTLQNITRTVRSIISLI